MQPNCGRLSANADLHAANAELHGAVAAHVNRPDLEPPLGGIFARSSGNLLPSSQ